MSRIRGIVERASAAALVGMFALLAAGTAHAQTTTVDTTADDTAEGHCTLREAINLVNGSGSVGTCAATGGGNRVIKFNIAGIGPFTITLASELPAIASSMSIIGGTTQATGVIISGNSSTQILLINHPVTVTLQNLSLQNGTSSGAGGAIQVGQGNLTIDNCTIFDNTAVLGGAIHTGRGTTLTVTNSTFSDNSISNTVPGEAAEGGAIDSDELTSALTLTNCTFSGNQANGVNAEGGAVALTLVRETDLKGNIFAGNLVNGSLGNCAIGSLIFHDNGYNIADDSSCRFTAMGTSQVITPTGAIGLAPGLGNNGGPTETIALTSPNSVANSIIPAADCTDQSSPPQPLTTDQRGVKRPVNGTCSAGAYQYLINCSTAYASKPNLTALLPMLFFPEYVHGVNDANGGYKLKITGVTQDKPVPRFPLCPNAFWSGTTTFLRTNNEPLQPGPSGLLYQIQFTATDTETGVSCSGAAPVCVQGLFQGGQQCLAALDTSFDATKCP